MIAIALATILSQTPSPAPIVPPTDAEENFQKKCALCHGSDGRGKTKKGREYKAPNFTSKKFQKQESDDEIRDAITNGVPKTKMRGFKDKLTAEQIEALFRYVRALGQKKKS